jgi:hypothetical protein
MESDESVLCRANETRTTMRPMGQTNSPASSDKVNNQWSMAVEVIPQRDTGEVRAAESSHTVGLTGQSRSYGEIAANPTRQLRLIYILLLMKILESWFTNYMSIQLQVD